MKVIARNNGSYKQDAYFNIVREGLIQGKEYTVEQITSLIQVRQNSI